MFQKRTPEEMTARGILRFVLLHGVIGWGIPASVIFTLLMGFMQGKWELSDALENLAIFSICGIFFGLWCWFRLKRRMAKSLRHAAARGE